MDESSQFALALVAGTAVKLLSAEWFRKKKEKQFEQVGTISGLTVFPVKSCRGISLQSARCTVPGLQSDDVTDRHWMVTRPNGDFLTQRQEPKMALIATSIHDNMIYLDAPGMTTLKLPKSPKVNKSNIRMCRVWGVNVEALDCGEEADNWVRKFLQMENIHLVCSPDGMPKRDASLETKPWGNPAQPGDLAAFADFCGYLVLPDASVQSLNTRLSSPVTITNFRPNITIAGTNPFDEDNWEEIKIGDSVYLRCLDPCTRCKLTTVNPESGVKDPNKEPLKTLKTFRCFPTYGDSPIFGINAALDRGGNISVGDPVYVLRKK